MNRQFPTPQKTVNNDSHCSCIRLQRGDGITAVCFYRNILNLCNEFGFQIAAPTRAIPNRLRRRIGVFGLPPHCVP